jgi:protein-disulfide isomerase
MVSSSKSLWRRHPGVSRALLMKRIQMGISTRTRPRQAARILVLLGIAAILWRTEVRVTRLEGAARTAVAPPSSNALVRTGQVAADGVLVGRPEAPLSIVQFTDYECPFCRKFAEQTLPTLYEKYIAAGKVRLIVRDLPLPNHPNARIYAAAARCADRIGADNMAFQLSLYRNAAAGPEAALATAAADGSADLHALTTCINSDSEVEGINADIAAAEQLGVRGTPSFVVGTSGDKVNGRFIQGSLDAEAYSAIIDSLLALPPRVAR